MSGPQMTGEVSKRGDKLFGQVAKTDPPWKADQDRRADAAMRSSDETLRSSADAIQRAQRVLQQTRSTPLPWTPDKKPGLLGRIRRLRVAKSFIPGQGWMPATKAGKYRLKEAKDLRGLNRASGYNQHHNQRHTPLEERGTDPLWNYHNRAVADKNQDKLTPSKRKNVLFGPSVKPEHHEMIYAALPKKVRRPIAFHHDEEDTVGRGVHAHTMSRAGAGKPAHITYSAAVQPHTLRHEYEHASVRRNYDRLRRIVENKQKLGFEEARADVGANRKFKLPPDHLSGYEGQVVIHRLSRGNKEAGLAFKHSMADKTQTRGYRDMRAKLGDPVPHYTGPLGSFADSEPRNRKKFAKSWVPGGKGVVSATRGYTPAYKPASAMSSSERQTALMRLKHTGDSITPKEDRAKPLHERGNMGLTAPGMQAHMHMLRTAPTYQAEGHKKVRFAYDVHPRDKATVLASLPKKLKRPVTIHSAAGHLGPNSLGATYGRVGRKAPAHMLIQRGVGPDTIHHEFTHSQSKANLYRAAMVNNNPYKRGGEEARADAHTLRALGSDKTPARGYEQAAMLRRAGKQGNIAAGTLHRETSDKKETDRYIKLRNKLGQPVRGPEHAPEGEVRDALTSVRWEAQNQYDRTGRRQVAKAFRFPKKARLKPTGRKKADPTDPTAQLLANTQANLERYNAKRNVEKSLIPGQGFKPITQIPRVEARALKTTRAPQVTAIRAKEAKGYDLDRYREGISSEFIRENPSPRVSGAALQARSAPGAMLAPKAFHMNAGGKNVPGKTYHGPEVTPTVLAHEQAHGTPKRTGYRSLQIGLDPLKSMREEARADYRAGVDYTKPHEHDSTYARGARNPGVAEQARASMKPQWANRWSPEGMAAYREVQDKMRTAGARQFGKVDTTMSEADAQRLAAHYDTRGPLPKKLSRDARMKAYEARYIASGGREGEKWQRRADLAETSRNIGLAGATAGAALTLAARHKGLAPKLKKVKITHHGADNAALGAAAYGGASELYGEHARSRRASFRNSPAGVAGSALSRMQAYTPEKKTR